MIALSGVRLVRRTREEFSNDVKSRVLALLAGRMQRARRKTVLDEGLNTLLSVQLFEVSQHLDAAGKVDVFRFISDQKAALEKTA